MKTNLFAKIMVLAIILILCTGFTAFGATDVKVYVNNEKVEFDANPIIENGRIFVSLRGVFEKLGAVVDWNKNISEVVVKDSNTEIEMILGKDKVIVNGEVKSIDAPIRMINSRTFVPVRFVSENLGHTVKWDQNTASVYITKNDTAIISKNMVMTVDSKENLTALLEYNSKLYSYIWPREVILDTAVMNDGVTGSSSASGSSEAATSSKAIDSSDTNNQVEGVQEGDIIKNDGKYIYINIGTGLRIIDSNPVKPKIAASIEVPENTIIDEIFIADGKLVVIGQNNYFQIMHNDNKLAEAMPYRNYENRTNVLIYNVENIEKPVLEKEYLFDGNYLSGRTIDDKLYLISSRNLNYQYDSNEEPDISLPYYTDVLSNSKYEFGYDEIKYFPGYIASRYMYTIGIDLGDKTSIPHVDVYLGGSDAIYVSKNSMYAAITDYSYDNIISKAAQAELYNPSYSMETVVYKFKLNNGNVDVAAQGRVPGTIINQFSMDEYEGMFRIATTTGEQWQGTSGNNLYILDDNLKTTGKLENLAEGERIYSTRFAGDRVYMVTYKQVDPLFVIDTSNPQNPVVEGMLKIPGYSTYLHMIDENHIMGFGYNTQVNSFGATANDGMKISLFDVTDPNKPREVHTEVIGKAGTYSEVLHNHKALMFSLDRGLMSFPVRVTKDDYNTEFLGAYVYNVDTESFSLKNKISHGSGGTDTYNDQIRRVIFINDNLYSFSDNTMQVYNIEDNKKISEMSIK